MRWGTFCGPNLWRPGATRPSRGHGNSRGSPAILARGTLGRILGLRSARRGRGAMTAQRSVLTPAGLRTWAIIVTIIAALAFCVVYYIFITTSAGQRVDEIAFDGSALGRTRLWRFADPILDVVSVGFVVLVLVGTATVAILRQRSLLIVQVGIVMGGANIATQLFKRSEERRVGRGGRAWG